MKEKHFQIYEIESADSGQGYKMKIELVDMQKSFGRQIIFHDFNLIINSGEMVSIMGKSGSGKTTLMNILGLIEKMDAGKILYDNKLIDRDYKRKKILGEKIGFVFQNFGLIDNETVFSNLALVKRLQQKQLKAKRILICDALKSVGLDENYAHKKVYECSGGEQQRIAIAKLLLKDCSIIFADEPTASLDIDNKNIVMDHLKKLYLSGKTIVIVTHDHDICGYCDRVITI